MDLYLWWVIIGIVLIILEFLSPTMFLLNLGIASLLTAIFAYLGFSQIIQAIIFLISAGILLLFVKPILQRFYNNKFEIKDQYIGKIVKVTQKTDKNDGRISIYGEEWQARAINSNDVFDIESQVKIIKRESLILYVDKVEGD